MKDGFVRVAAVTPTVTVADCISNRMEIERRIRQLKEADPKVIVFPELCLTGYECRDLFWQSELLRSAMEQLAILAEHTADVDATAGSSASSRRRICLPTMSSMRRGISSRHRIRP